MAHRIRVLATIRISSSPERVRAQYRDIDHHIRNNVHPSIHFEWEQGAPGERKVRSTFRILGLPQFDVALLEDAPDGSFLIRYLEGTNAGMIVEHRFVEVEPSVTEVQLCADAPSTLGRKILGPLFVIGARQVMKKALAEDKRDLEGGDFRAGGAAGNVEQALASLAPHARASSSVKHAILEAACLISASDGSVDDAERDAIARMAKVLGAARGEAEPTGMLVRAEKLAETPAFQDELLRVGAELGRARVAREGVLAAAVVALVSEGMSLGELEALRALARAAGLAEDSLGPLIEVADSTLSAA